MRLRQGATRGNTHSSNARFPASLARLHGDDWLAVHATSVHQARPSPQSGKPDRRGAIEARSRAGMGPEQAAHGRPAWKTIRCADDTRTIELSLVARAFQPAGSRNFPVPCSAGSLGTGDWKVPRTRRQDSTVELNRRQRREQRGGTAPTRTAAHKDLTPPVKPVCGRNSTKGPLPPLPPLPPVH